MSIVPILFGGQRSSIFNPFSLDFWDSFKDFYFSYSLSTSRDNSCFVNPKINWKETPKAHVLKADLLGLKKEEVKVEIENTRVLQMIGERNVEKEDKNDKWHKVERSSGKFVRKCRLPENVKME
ncbi:hypothetical protein I3842_13G085300 [Carya illinoinensis]|uniref:SHSP domain-containing protein n=1 Tax=Carya illinoinensis TaxID=32201 RepID=A0A922AP37_CARIL|nr:hypothetical protein I3842_13G085300 [Carya illinoinensis]